MLISKEFKGRSIEEAISSGIELLGIDRDDATIEVVERESKGFLGFGKKDAVVKITYDDGKEEIKEEKPAEVIKKPAHKETFALQKESVKREQPVKKVKGVKEEPVKEDKPLVSEEEAERSEKAAGEFLEGVLKVMGVDAKLESRVDRSENTVHIELSGENMGFVIGRRGETLDALQYLTTIVTNKKEDSRWRVTLDTENYREKRTASLIALANKTANQAVKTGKSIALEPMSPQERRIIHSALQDNKAVTTFSTGQEPRRKIVIAPQGYKKKPQKNK